MNAMINTQSPEPQAKGDGNTLDFHSIFHTLQGEGPFSGMRAVFVRLAGCNLQCPWCDTEYTKGRYPIPIIDLVHAVRGIAKGAELVVITGGEPLRQPIGRFVKLLRDFDFTVQIESNGVYQPDPDLLNSLEYDPNVLLVVSPKTHRIHKDCARLAEAFKYVLDFGSIDPNDGLPIKALDHPNKTKVARAPEGKPIYVSPCETGDPERDRLNLQACAKAALKHGYICGVQLHKLIGLP
jgi:organic radical activating enzyme